MSGFRVFESWWQDLRHGVRLLRLNPGFFTVATLSLALGIGANTAVFSVVNAVLLRPLPYAEPDHLVNVWTTRPQRGINKSVASYPDFTAWREQNNVFEHVAAYTEQDFTLTGGDNPSRLGGMVVSSGLFPLIKVQAAIGRTFSADDDKNGAPLTAIPTMRNGRSNSHITGYRNRARSARGQHITSRMHQRRKLNMLLLW